MLLLLLACAPPPVDADGDGAFVPVDCDDADDAVHPGAPEACGNGVDDDCDGAAVGCGPAGWSSLDDADARVLGPVDDVNETRLQAVATAGDADGDGVADVLVRASRTWPDYASSVWLLPGPLAGDVALDDRAPLYDDATSGMLLAGGDLDGDGLADAALDAWDPAVEARALLLLAGPLGATGARASLALPPESWGGALVVVGDTDGDGARELALADASVSHGGESAGAVWVVPGTVAGEAAIDDVAARVDGTAEESVGGALAGGDVDGDGLADVVVDAGTWAWLLPGPVAAGAVADGDALAGTDGPLWALALGDVDGDGAPDLVLGGQGSPSDYTVGDELLGAAYVFLAPFDSPRGSDEADAALHGTPGAWYAGGAVAAADVDGDGRAEVAFTGSTGWGDGAVFLFGGGVTGTHDAVAADAALVGDDGADFDVLLGAGDLDADGFDDVLLLDSLHTSATDQRGAAWLVRGGPGF